MKLHPFSILYQLLVGRGWKVIKFVLSVLLLVPVFIPPGSGGQSYRNILVAAICIVIVYILYVFWEILYYQFFRYRIDENHIFIQSGVFFRTEREVPLNRIQNVDVNRGFLQRLLGLSEVRLETAGGGETEVVFQCVSKQTGTTLRDQLRRFGANKQNTKNPDERVPSESPECQYALSGESYFFMCLFSLNSGVFTWVLFSLPVVLLLIFSRSGSPSGAGVVLLLTFFIMSALALFSAWVVAAVATFAKYYDFQLLKFQDSLRFQRGLIQRRTGSIPLDKIQKLIIRENVLMRCFGFASLVVETAGYAPGESSGREAVIPLARREEVLKIARRVKSFPKLQLNHAPSRTRQRYTCQALFGLVALTGVLFISFHFSNLWNFPVVPIRYLWLSPLSLVPGAPIAGYLFWYHIGYQLSEDVCVLREGFWNRTTMIVPCYRLQTTICSQTIFQRFWNLRSLTIDTAGSYGFDRLNASAKNIDSESAIQLEKDVRKQFKLSLAKHRIRLLKQKTNSNDTKKLPPTEPAPDDDGQ